METASSMAPTTNHRESWDSLSSTFGHLEVSFSQDSCYGSDELSVSSKATAPLQSSASTFIANREEPALHPFLKSILKNSTANLQDEESDTDSESESGYGSDNIEFDYDALSEDEDDEDEMSDFSVWDDETSHDVPETHRDHTDSFDDSFIGFETSVRFDPSIQYIDTPDTEMSENELGPHSEMTVHEMMLLAQKSGFSQSSFHESDAGSSYDDSDCGHKESCRMNTMQLDDFTRDAVDVDQRLFIAYMHGIRGITDANYKTYLHTQADNIRLGQETESMHPDDPPCMYLDRILSHVIGVFRNLLTEEELNGLIELRKEDLALAPASDLNPHQILLARIEQILLNRLTNGHVDVLPDELSFFAGGIAHVLGTEEMPAF